MNRKNNIKLALAQLPIAQHQSYEAWQTYIEKWVLDAVKQSADLLVFPEYGCIDLTSFATENVKKDLREQIRYLSDLNLNFIETFQKLSHHHSVYIVAPTIPFFVTEKNKTVNRCYLFSSTGQYNFQDKLFMTRFEDEHWGISSAESVDGEFIQKVFETEIGNVSISTCFDIEFSEPAFAAALAGAEIMIAPSCTETIQGCQRVHIGARARALENQFYVAVSQTVGEALWSIATDVNTGFAAVYSPPDIDFPDDGILAKGQLNKTGWLTAHVALDKIKQVRQNGSVLNYSRRQALPSFGKIKYQIDVLR